MTEVDSCTDDIQSSTLLPSESISSSNSIVASVNDSTDSISSSSDSTMLDHVDHLANPIRLIPTTETLEESSETESSILSDSVESSILSDSVESSILSDSVVSSVLSDSVESSELSDSSMNSSMDSSRDFYTENDSLISKEKDSSTDTCATDATSSKLSDNHKLLEIELVNNIRSTIASKMEQSNIKKPNLPKTVQLPTILPPLLPTPCEQVNSLHYNRSNPDNDWKRYSAEIERAFAKPRNLVPNSSEDCVENDSVYDADTQPYYTDSDSNVTSTPLTSNDSLVDVSKISQSNQLSDSEKAFLKSQKIGSKRSFEDL